MNLSIQLGLNTLFPKITKFSDGATNLELDEVALNKWHGKSINVNLNVEDCNKDLINLCLLKDVLDNLNIDKKIYLNMPYIPNARADRRFSRGGSFSLKVFCNIINSLSFDKVCVCDPHSEVSSGLLDRVVITNQEVLLGKHRRQIERDFSENFTLCAPDLGATKKTFACMQYLGGTYYYQAIKIRDVLTGNIVKCDLIEKEVSGDVLIVDDISDGGASFLHLARLLKERGANKVGLFVSHGIFSKGLEHLVDIDYIICDNLIERYINKRDIQLFNKKGEIK